MMRVPTISSAIPPTPYNGQSPASSRTQSASVAQSHEQTEEASEVRSPTQNESTPTPPKTPTGSVGEGKKRYHVNLAKQVLGASNSPVQSASRNRSRPPTNKSTTSNRRTPSATSNRRSNAPSPAGSQHASEATPIASPDRTSEGNLFFNEILSSYKNVKKEIYYSRTVREFSNPLVFKCLPIE